MYYSKNFAAMALVTFVLFAAGYLLIAADAAIHPEMYRSSSILTP